MNTTYENIMAIAKEGAINLEGNSQYDSFLETRIDLGIRRIADLNTRPVKECAVEVQGGQICLPKGYQEFIGLDMQDNQPAMVDFKTLGALGCSCSSSSASYSNMMDVQNGWIVFRDHNRYPDDKEGCLIYIGRNVDEHGRSVVREEYEEALAEYLTWQYMRKFRKQFGESAIKEARNQFIRAKIAINANAVATHQREHKEQWSSIINAWPFSNNTY